MCETRPVIFNSRNIGKSEKKSMIAKKFGKEITGFLSILPMGAILFIVYLVGEWFDFYTILTPQKRFLIEAVILIADSFFINAIAVFFVPLLMFGDQHKVAPFKALAKSFSFLPKVIISYFVLMLFAQFAFEVSQSSPIPALIVLVFFIWAPYFVALEQFADQTPAEEDDDEDSNFLDPFDEQGFTERPKTLFSKKSVWQLGFIRSLEFTSKNASLAISIVFILWLVKVIPELLIGLTLDVNSSFSAVVLQVLTTCLGALFMNMYIVSAIFRALEPAQRSELYEPLSEDLKKKQPEIIISSPNGIRVAVLCLLVIFTTAIWSEQKIQLRSFPEGLSFTVNEFSKKDREVVFKLEIIDLKGKFRWFEPSRFRFLVIDPKDKLKEKTAVEGNAAEKGKAVVEGASAAATPVPVPSFAGAFAPILKLLAEKLVTPSRVVVYDQGGKVIPERQYSPRDEKLKIVLAFPIRDEKKGKAPILYELSYLNPFGLKQVLLTFSEESGQGIVGKSIVP